VRAIENGATSGKSKTYIRLETTRNTDGTVTRKEIRSAPEGAKIVNKLDAQMLEGFLGNHPGSYRADAITTMKK